MEQFRRYLSCRCMEYRKVKTTGKGAHDGLRELPVNTHNLAASGVLSLPDENSAANIAFPERNPSSEI